MLFELCYEGSANVRSLLRDAKVPTSLEWLGDDRFPGEDARLLPTSIRALVDYDFDGTDTYAPGVGTRSNPPSFASVQNACVITVEGQSTKQGANLHDHQRTVRRVVDAIVCALVKASHVRRMPIPSMTGRFVPIGDGADGSATSARYRLQFAIGRSVLDIPYESVDGSGLALNLTTKARHGAAEQPVCGEGD